MIIYPPIVFVFDVSIYLDTPLFKSIFFTIQITDPEKHRKLTQQKGYAIFRSQFSSTFYSKKWEEILNSSKKVYDVLYFFDSSYCKFSKFYCQYQDHFQTVFLNKKLFLVLVNSTVPKMCVVCSSCCDIKKKLVNFLI